MNISQNIDKLNIKDDFYLKKNNTEELFNLLRDNKFDLFLDFLMSFDKKEIDLNINTKDQYGNNLLFLAVMKNQRKIIKKLLEFNARSDIFDQEGHSVLFYPIKNGYNDMIDLLIEYNKKNIGVNIINIIDKKGLVPLLYCIKYKNVYALQKLLMVGADPNYKNQSDINILYYAVQRKDIIMIRMLLKSIRNIDTPGPNGSTPLLASVLFNENDIAYELIKNNADPNVSENRYNYTPIFYSVIQNNTHLSKILIDTKLNINHQDYMGMTPIHHAIINKSYEILDYIFNSYELVKEKDIMSENINGTKSDSKNIHPNLVNIDGLTILHTFIYYYEESFAPHIIKIIPYANLNIQDNKGNTPMHLIFQNDIFAKLNISNVFVNKKINISIKNNLNKTIFDYVKLNEIETFTTILIDTYYAYLKKHNNDLLVEWQKECSNKNLDNFCRDKIRSEIIGNKINIPARSSKKLIHIVNNTIVNFSTFTGTVLDLIVGFKYLVKKHSNSAILLYPTSDTDSVTESITDPSQHLTEFEVKWMYQRLIFPSNFDSKLKILIDNTKCRYILIPLGIIMDSGFHSNCILIDLHKKIVERFEPHGSSYPFQFNYNPNRLDNIIDKSFASILKSIYGDIDIKYISPNDYLPKIGFQTFEGVEIQTNTFIGDPNGFCTLWCIWYLDYRLHYSELSPKKIVEKLIKTIRLESLSFRTVIRNYSKNITDLRDIYLEKIESNINEYISKKLTLEKLQQLLHFIIND